MEHLIFINGDIELEENSACMLNMRRINTLKNLIKAKGSINAVIEFDKLMEQHKTRKESGHINLCFFRISLFKLMYNEK
jgi:hypothetical protein